MGGWEVRAGVAGRVWEEGMCVVGRGLIHVLGLAPSECKSSAEEGSLPQAAGPLCVGGQVGRRQQ